jgi:hypothetical protein
LLATYHILETLPHELGLELRACEALGDVLAGEDLVCEVGAGFEGERLGEHERVVAVEEDGGDLLRVLVSTLSYNIQNKGMRRGRRNRTAYLRHIWILEDFKQRVLFLYDSEFGKDFDV